MPQQSSLNMQTMMGDGMSQRMAGETAYAAPPDRYGEGRWVYEVPGDAYGGGMQDMTMRIPPVPSGETMDVEIRNRAAESGNADGSRMNYDSYAQSQRMKNPVNMEITHSPENNRDAYMASLRSLLSRNVGYFIVCTFLVGTQQSITWQGILHTVGSDYLVLYQPENERYVSCDLYALKFAQFHNVRSTPYCAGARVWEGRNG